MPVIYGLMAMGNVYLSRIADIIGTKLALYMMVRKSNC